MPLLGRSCEIISLTCTLQGMWQVTELNPFSGMQATLPGLLEVMNFKTSEAVMPQEQPKTRLEIFKDDSFDAATGHHSTFKKSGVGL